MPHNRRTVVVAVAAVVGAAAVVTAVVLSRGEPSTRAAGAVPTSRVVQPGAPGQTSRTLSPDELAQLSAPAHNAADADFMRDMIAHHLQALEMTALVADRAAGADIPQLARRVEVSQRDEVALLQRWLVDRDEPLPEPHTDHVGHGDLMPGMLDAADLSALAAARGPAFDRLFLELMVRHHQGALTMVDQLYRSGGGVEPESDRLAREITADQTIEIRRMQDMLAAL